MNRRQDEGNSLNGPEIQMERTDKNQLEMRPSKKNNRGHDVLYTPCFTGGDYQSQYEEECPVNYSLKYSETEACKGNKSEPSTGVKFKGFAEPSETDLDQPTDFSLKYGEKTSPCDFIYFPRPEAEEVSGRQAAAEDHYGCEDQTPLMFSRCSSLTSLSSFDHITQSIPDDRSSVVSDFSRTTSGIISPSELPDSPTQTAPSSPRRNKLVCFTAPREKKSVFEDDVATYKQEDTPIEFSRATSLSSLNIYNPTKQEFNLKTNSKASSVAGGDEIKNKESGNCLCTESVTTDRSNIKEEVLPVKTEAKIEIEGASSATEVDLILTEGLNNIRLNETRNDLEEPAPNEILPAVPPPDLSQHATSKVEFSVKRKIRPIFSDPTYEASDDDVHTYHTEGTPANISHAGSHSDLSTLSLISGIPPSGTENNSDDDSFCSGSEAELLPECSQIEITVPAGNDGFKSIDEQAVNNLFPKSCTPLEEALVEQCIRLGMPQKTSCKKKDAEESSFKSLDGRPLGNWFTKSCTPLQEALVEQCIRLGMPQKNKKPEGSHSSGQPTPAAAKVKSNMIQPVGFIHPKSANQRISFNGVKTRKHTVV